MTARDQDDETLPFEVEIEQLPRWAHAASAGVIAVGILVAAGLIPMVTFLPVLVVSSVGRRFASSAMHVEVTGEELLLGSRSVPRAEILDAWLDDDEAEPRVALAIGEEDAALTILHFVNREQARRFAAALGGKSAAIVAGHRPRWIDSLSSLRFVAIAAAFFGTKSWYGFLGVALFVFSAYAFVRAKQIIARSDRFEVRSAFGVKTQLYTAVEAIDVETGAVGLPDGGEIQVARSAVRDTTLATPAWLDRARRRALLHIEKTARIQPKS